MIKKKNHMKLLWDCCLVKPLWENRIIPIRIYDSSPGHLFQEYKNINLKGHMFIAALYTSHKIFMFISTYKCVESDKSTNDAK